MLQGITWSDFFIYTGSAAAIYYLFVLSWLGVKGWLNRSAAGPLPTNTVSPRRVWQPQEAALVESESQEMVTQPTPQPVSTTEPETVTADIRLIDLLEELVNDIDPVIANYPPQSLWETLSEPVMQEIARYPLLHQAPYKEAIHAFVAKLMKQYHQQELPEDALTAVWE